MSNSPAYYRARIEDFALALAYENTLPESREQKQRVCYLRNGFVPDGFLSNNKTEYEFNIGSGLFRTIPQYIKEFSKNNNDELTPLELHTLDTWFALHPEKVCGVQKGGSGFSFPVKTIGTKQDIINAIDATLQSNTKPNELNLNNKPIKPKTNLNTQYFCCERFSDGAKKVLQPQGIKVILPQFENINFFAHKGIYVSDGFIKDEKYWNITEVKTGVSVVTGKSKITTKQSAINKAIEIINENGGEQGLIAAIEKPINNLCADNVVTPATKTNLSLYKYKAKAISIKLKLLQA